ncbi:MAG TPA: hypothetical protein VKT22_14715 [Steroidobacteraceae bacterium]|nr:hypothetical protein [Steroidobacteraceae bacterium]
MRTPFARLTVLVLLFAVGAMPAPLRADSSGARSSVEASEVPDVVARAAGLKLKPMARAARLYALNCQGCHGEAGVSVPEIPRLAGRVGYFARLAEGRRYLVQLPNVALNPSSDADIAEILNFVLLTFSRAQLPADFHPYRAAEVGALRRERIEPAARRRQVVAALLAARRIPSSDVLSLPQPVLY